MDSSAWQQWFRSNQHRASPVIPARVEVVDPEVRGPLVYALQCFQLGEAGEGRVAHEAARSDDPALDEALKESVALYVREEGRHARELSLLLRAMGEPTLKKHASAWLFERSRRALGLRAKMAVIAVAEVVGAAFYDVLATRVDVPAVASVGRAIAGDERRHLAFQRDYFRRVIAVTHPAARPLLAVGLGLWFLAGLAGAIATVALGHRRLFRALGMSPFDFARLCVAQLDLDGVLVPRPA